MCLIKVPKGRKWSLTTCLSRLSRSKPLMFVPGCRWVGRAGCRLRRRYRCRFPVPGCGARRSSDQVSLSWSVDAHPYLPLPRLKGQPHSTSVFLGPPYAFLISRLPPTVTVTLVKFRADPRATDQTSRRLFLPADDRHGFRSWRLCSPAVHGNQGTGQGRYGSDTPLRQPALQRDGTRRSSRDGSVQ
jgi:hypothetical protein